MKILVFVYGTLKKGYGNDRHYCKGYKEIIPAKIKGVLYDLGAYPMALIENKYVAYVADEDDLDADIAAAEAKTSEGANDLPGETITGEIVVFEGDEDEIADRMAGLDGLEGHNTFYERVLVLATDIKGKKRLVWTYRCPSGKKPSGWLLEDGVWPKEVEEAVL